MYSYLHFTSHPYGKLGPWAKMCIFLRYPKGSKRYVFLGENDDGTQTELESRIADFLNRQFLSIGETSRDIEFFEEKDEPALAQEGVNPLVSGSGESDSGDSDSLDDHEPSSDTHDPPMTESQDPRRSQHGKILHPDPWDWRGCGHGRCSQLDVVKPMSCKRVLMLEKGKK